MNYEMQKCPQTYSTNSCIVWLFTDSMGHLEVPAEIHSWRRAAVWQMCMVLIIVWWILFHWGMLHSIVSGLHISSLWSYPLMVSDIIALFQQDCSLWSSTHEWIVVAYGKKNLSLQKWVACKEILYYVHAAKQEAIVYFARQCWSWDWGAGFPQGDLQWWPSW